MQGFQFRESRPNFGKVYWRDFNFGEVLRQANDAHIFCAIYFFIAKAAAGCEQQRHWQSECNYFFHALIFKEKWQPVGCHYQSYLLI